MCDHLRSIVRSRTRTLALSALWPQISSVVRDTILGPREAGDAGRKGRFFAENGMQVTEVEILEAEIQDAVISEMMQAVQRESVTLTIGDRQAQEKLASVTLRAELERQRLELEAAAKEREAKLADLVRRLQGEAKLSEVREKEALLKEQLELVSSRELTESRSRIERESLHQQANRKALGEDASARASAAAAMHEEEIAHLGRLRALDIQVLEAQARAAVAERTAVQPQLVEALTALGDKAVLSEVAGNMNLISLFRGKEAGEILKDVVGGSRFVPALQEALGARPAPAPAPAPTKK